LTQAAQKILQMEENRGALINALEQKGYNVQLFITTTVVENNPIVTDENFGREDRRQQQDDGQSQQGRGGARKQA
jgi:hypothetical protein